jgi:hypothetical protein
VLLIIQHLPEHLHVTQDGLLMDFVMIIITTWIAFMMAETVVDVTSAQLGVQNANALIPMEAEVEQLAHKQRHAMTSLDGLEITFVMT